MINLWHNLSTKLLYVTFNKQIQINILILYSLNIKLMNASFQFYLLDRHNARSISKFSEKQINSGTA